MFSGKIKNMLKYLFWFAFAVILTIATDFQSAAQSSRVVSEKAHKIVFQLASADSLTQKGFIRNINNVKEAMPNAQIEIVLHGLGVDILRKNLSIYPEDLQKIAASGVKLVICENTLRERKIDKSDFPDFVSYVQAGIAEIILKEEDGWHYVKLGR